VTATIESIELRRVFGAFPTGVTALAALVDGRPAGLAASSFTSVSLVPPIASVCVARTSTTWPSLRSRDRIGVSVLGESQGEVCRALAAPGTERFRSVGWRATPDGAVVLDGSRAWFECAVVEEIEAGDHSIVLLDVHEIGVDLTIAPLVFCGSEFHRLAN
jgi:flavin reductase (DIM6/NTAB) family NADH-FMN oxidoreductase RutF